MRKIISISLLFSFLAPLGIHLGLLHWQLKKHKREVKFSYLRLDENRHLLTSFTFTEQQYQNLDWEEPHEFKMNGEKFDVIEVVKQGDTLQLWCFRDHDEEKLDHEIEQAVLSLLGNEGDQNDSKPKDSKDGVKFFIPPSTSPRLKNVQQTFCQVPKRNPYTIPSLNVELPPPQHRF